MKCIKTENEVRRVSNSDAEKLVKTERWQYCKKAEWKAAGRPMKGTS